jgi:beta-mannanase
VSFASWRGTNLRVVAGWIDWRNGWSGMNRYASGTQPRSLRSKSPNVSFGHGLFPKGGNLAACAKGQYDAQQREVARRLANNGVGNAEIRLGWEASGDWFPWSAAGKSPDQWKTCFTRVAKAMKSGAPKLRIGWFVAKKGRIDVRTIYPAGAPISVIGISHYDDAQARFGNETFKGGPWGLRAFLKFAQSKGKKLAIGEWGVGRRGDNPDYVRKMHAFLKEAGNGVAHEAYFNTGKYQLYPKTKLPRSAAAYRELF